MTLEQKVAQMLFVTPEQLTGVELATVAGALTRDALTKLPIGGVVYFGANIVGNQQLRDLLSGTVELSRGAGAGIPVFTGVDEEGGTLVARVAKSGCFDVETFQNMWWIGQSGDPSRAAYVEMCIRDRKDSASTETSQPTGTTKVESTIYDTASNYFAALNSGQHWINFNPVSYTPLRRRPRLFSRARLAAHRGGGAPGRLDCSACARGRLRGAAGGSCGALRTGDDPPFLKDH